MKTQVIHCPECQNVIAVRRETGSWEIRRKGRIIVCLGVSEITCERCSYHWHVPAEARVLAAWMEAHPDEVIK